MNKVIPIRPEAMLKAVDAARQLRAGGEPPDNGGMELTERVIRVEEKLSGVDKRLALVEKDLRDLGKKMDAHFYWVLAAFAGMAVLMAKGFKWF